MNPKNLFDTYLGSGAVGANGVNGFNLGLFRGMAIYSLLSNANNLFTVYHSILYALVHRTVLTFV